MARASAARLRMPPEICDGRLWNELGSSPTSISLRLDSSSIRSDESLVCSCIGTATFSTSVSVENSAPSWNITPQRRS